MLSDIVTAINILSEIYNIYEKLKEDQILFRRLCERVQLFTKFLQELQTNCANPNYKPTASLKDYTVQLTTLLGEVKDFLTKHSKKSKSFYGSFKRIIITTSFRNKFTNDLNSLNQRINDCVTNLLPSLGINFEEQRRLDTEALKNKIDYVAGDVVNQVEEKIDEVLYKILNEINLSKDEKQRRQELLGQVNIPPSARVEVTETVLGKGGFGTIFLGVYGASKVAIKALNSRMDEKWNR